MTIVSTSMLLFVTIALFLPLWTLACECPDWPPSPSDASDTLFRGVVLRELTADATARKFVVDVKRIFTGCTFKAAERIVVTTTPLPELCGQDLVIDKEYLFAGENVVLDAATKKQLGRNTKITRAVSVSACDYTRPWADVSGADRTVLRAYKNTCPKACGADIDCLKGTCKNNKCVA